MIPGMLFTDIGYHQVDRLAPLLLGRDAELEQGARKAIVDLVLADLRDLGAVPLGRVEVSAERAFLQIDGRWVQGSAWHGRVTYGV